MDTKTCESCGKDYITKECAGCSDTLTYTQKFFLNIPCPICGGKMIQVGDLADFEHDVVQCEDKNDFAITYGGEQQLINDLLDNIDNDDDNLQLLEDAMEYWCSTHDKCEGYKHAIRLCTEDQYSNHESEQSGADLLKLIKLLTK